MLMLSFSWLILIILHNTWAMLPGMILQTIAIILVVTYGALTVIMNGGTFIFSLVRMCYHKSIESILISIFDI